MQVNGPFQDLATLHLVKDIEEKGYWPMMGNDIQWIKAAEWTQTENNLPNIVLFKVYLMMLSVVMTEEGWGDGRMEKIA
jgi:hypothetical protein